ncbi:hypothetical protein ACH42_03790 [Endozoicomonas sp. (ex Bugula neritina AB1)]|nr:hypothetical protein ACH42_03790 [Endozoicomonas sp. (ex Bugula neritina AB1)]
MISSLNTVIEKRLESLDLTPKLIENLSAKASLWSLQLAKNIEAELLCHIIDKSDITLTLIVSMDTVVKEEELNAFTIAIAQIAPPITFTSVKKAVTTRLQIKTDLQSLSILLAEAIILTRHYTGPLFWGVFELQSQKRNLKETIEETLKRLQHSGQAA